MCFKPVVAGILLLLLPQFSCTSKKGCIDPGSVTYDPHAKIDDGSCAYPQFSLTPNRIVKLSSGFNEVSAAKYVDSRVFFIIDPPGEKRIYSLDMLTGNAKEVIEIPGISAVNFEAVTASDTHFFIGDIGNNSGDRTDLVIYKVPKPAVYASQTTVSSYETIRFSYPEQTDFRKNELTNYDAESLMYCAGKLYIFTKNHQDNKTALYELPSDPGVYSAELKGIFDVKGLITDADVNSSGNKVALIGHNESSGKAFLWILSDFEGTKFFSGKKNLVDIGTIYTVGQVEGVSFYDDSNLFITNENAHSVDPSLYYLDITAVQ